MRNSLFQKGVIVGIIGLLVGAVLLNIDAQKLTNYTRSDRFDEPNKQLLLNDYWWKYHHDNANTGFSSSSAPETNNTLWSAPIQISTSRVQPIIVKEKIYCATNEHILYCMNNTNGVEIWNYQTNGMIRTTPAVVSNKIYFGCHDGYLYCLNSENGTFLWKRLIGISWLPDVSSSPAIESGRLFIGTEMGKFYCLDAENGEIYWIYDTGQAIHSSPSVFNNKVYIGNQVGMFYCFDINDGHIIWSHQYPSSIHSSPAIANDKIYFGMSNKVYCLNPNNGTMLWNYTLWYDDIFYSTPALAYNNVYIGAGGSLLFCLNASTGNVTWTFPVGPYYGDINPIVADNKIYTGTNSGFYCLNASTGNIFWSYNQSINFGSPSIADEKIYVGSGDGHIYCFGRTNQCPNIPSITGPHCGKILTMYTFSLGSITDPEEDQLYCLWEWGDGNISGWQGPVDSGETINASHTWDVPGIYTIKAKIKDSYGLESNWSEPFTLYIASKMFLIGLIKNIVNQSEGCTIFNMSLAIIIKMNPFDIKIYSSIQILLLLDEFQGLITQRILVGCVYGLIL